MAKIGLPSLKLNNAGVKSKNCGSFKSVAEEALQERKGHDPDIDLAKSQNNIYTGYRTAEELMEYSRQHIQQLKDKSGRGIRKDAVVMCVTVLKPPADFMNKMSREEQIRFLGDAEKAFMAIVGEENIKSTAIHFDELGAHEHVFWEPMTEDGRLCAKEMHNLKFFGRVNRELPEKLREAGWEIEDCEMYDAAKEDYENERKKGGQSSVKFKAEAEREKQEALEMANEMIYIVEEKKQELSEIQMSMEATKQTIESLKADKKRIERGTAEAFKALKEYTPKIVALRDKKVEFERELPVLKEQISEAKAELKTVETAIKEKMDMGEALFTNAGLQERLRLAREQQKEKERVRHLERLVAQFERFLEAVPIAKGLYLKWLKDERQNDIQIRRERKKEKDIGD